MFAMRACDGVAAGWRWRLLAVFGLWGVEDLNLGISATTTFILRELAPALFMVVAALIVGLFLLTLFNPLNKKEAE